MSQDPLIGQVLGGARIQQRVSKGLLAGVYRGHYERLGIPVAVKVLTTKAMAQGMNKERFVREGRALAQLSHPNIIKIYNVGHEANRYFIIMDWIQDGMNLRQLAQTRPLTPAQSLKVVQRLCDALNYIHSKGLIHRDVKPANVCLRRGGHPVLMDFSLIKDEHADVKLTAPGTIMGTVNFMPPEQAQPGGPFGDVNPRSDVYSLGGTLYWLLTGKPPFKGRTPMETIIKLMREEPEAPSKSNPSLSPEIDKLVLTTLSKRQEDRPANALELAQRIEQIFQAQQASLMNAQRPPLADDGSGRQPTQPKPTPAAAPGAQNPNQWGSGSAQDQKLREAAGAESAPVGQPGPAPMPQVAPAQHAPAAQQHAPAAHQHAPAALHAAAAVAQAEPPAPAPYTEPAGYEAEEGEAAGFSPSFSTEAAAAGQLRLPPELLTPEKPKTSIGRLVLYTLLVLASVAGIGIFIYVVLLDNSLF